MKAVVAGLFINVVWVGKIGCEEGHLTIVAKSRVGLLELGVDADAFIEDETFPLEVVAAHFLEILENSSLELEDIFKTLSFHQWTSFFATDATRTKHNEGLRFEFGI